MNLTDLEMRILKAVAANGGARMTIEQLAHVANCSADTIYQRLANKQDFQELFKEALVNSLTGEMPEVLSSFVEEAKGGSFKHGKLLMELTGIYKEDKKVTHNVNLREVEQPFKDDSERKKFLKATLSEIFVEEEDEKDD
jgi:AcrR family transcriptional regulator